MKFLFSVFFLYSCASLLRRGGGGGGGSGGDGGGGEVCVCVCPPGAPTNARMTNAHTTNAHTTNALTTNGCWVVGWGGGDKCSSLILKISS